MKFIFFLIRLPVAAALLPVAIGFTILGGAILISFEILRFVGALLKSPLVFFKAAMRNDPDEVRFHNEYNLVFDVSLDQIMSPMTRWWRWLVGE